MTEFTTAPYGEWVSPITPDLLTATGVSLRGVVVEGAEVYWTEGRPLDGGRQVIVQRSPDGAIVDRTPIPFNARTRVHEYGGAACCVDRGTIYFANFADQRVYRQAPGGQPVPLTPAVDLRYADAVVDRSRRRLIGIREDHRDASREAVNTIVAVDVAEGGEGQVLVSGNDFYSNPRLSPDGRRLAWLTWNHPNMPWDGCELWVSPVDNDGSLGPGKLVAGGIDESICQPEWGPEGALYFISDRSGWWNLYRWRGGATIEPFVQVEADLGVPAWVFGTSTYGIVDNRAIACTYVADGSRRLALVDCASGASVPIETSYSRIDSLRAGSGRLVFIGSSPTMSAEVVVLDLPSRTTQVLRRSRGDVVEPRYLSAPVEIEFPTEGGLTAFGYFYPPKNPDFAPPAADIPPLIVFSHGGPTAATDTALSLSIQFWTSRGFAILDVNYGGSTGYGREYRRRLSGKWGIVDVDDCVNGALALVRAGKADPQRLAMRGGSAGGYTTLAALTFRDVFKAGASYFGISDLATLEEDTHKFESGYSNSLIGPYPEQRELYRERSPLFHADRLSCPVIFFQGLEDKVVPPNQTQLMIDAMRRKGLPVAAMFFEGEQHGFRKAETIKRTLEAELSFYGQIFHFTPAGPIEPVAIENLHPEQRA